MKNKTWKKKKNYRIRKTYLSTSLPFNSILHLLTYILNWIRLLILWSHFKKSIQFNFKKSSHKIHQIYKKMLLNKLKLKLKLKLNNRIIIQINLTTQINLTMIHLIHQGNMIVLDKSLIDFENGLLMIKYVYDF